MIGQRKQPYRSRALMRWVHLNMKPASCAVCCARPWTQLHHFGEDAAMGRKPSDHLIVRVCPVCAHQYEVKARALIRDGRHDLLCRFYADAAEIARSYMEYLEKHGGESVDTNGTEVF